ncbi:methyltransferase domain-containing protein [Flavobacterium sp. Fl-318]|uniref:Methyltransferase domain-containing protein n=1 Tax=Flavobacterium cupriresistens TaxID=2893885 RepID=A0ABU4R879_9FLAO|nr:MULTISPECIES: class I SAM-dependent methyltransferase [unclassified Flavobacterium]MDX6188441.1 methyltransferase domain-containing protein [Flavobacterium sp. Fl-318]UFH44888.1 methyltransferase domain-containing protein [Flavobacterium sp. F-323]
MDIVKHNKLAWDNYVDKKDRWTIPVSDQELENVKNGNWSIVLTPKKAVPKNWFPTLKGLKILGLASGGGQQGPILATLGADVTIFDNSEKQLLQDKTLSDKFDLDIKTVQGDMKDLSVFADNSFDLIFNPCSILFVEDVLPVWKECFRVLKPNGILMTGLMNPISLQLDEKNLKLIYKQPFSDLHSLPTEELEELKKNKEALLFGHSLTDQIGGQLEAGFTITAMFEDSWGGENKIDEFLPAFIATRAIKPKE